MPPTLGSTGWSTRQDSRRVHSQQGLSEELEREQGAGLLPNKAVPKKPDLHSEPLQEPLRRLTIENRKYWTTPSVLSVVSIESSGHPIKRKPKMLNSGRNLSVTHAAVRSTRTATISMSTRNSPATPPLRLHITSWVPMFATNAGILLTTQVLSLRPMISSRSGTTYDQVARNQDVVTTKPRTGGEESLRLP